MSVGVGVAEITDRRIGYAFDIHERGTDRLICEASYTQLREPEGIQHLSARQAGQLARDTRAGQLVLTHQLPGADTDAHALEGAEAFGRPVSVAHEHVVYTV